MEVKAYPQVLELPGKHNKRVCPLFYTMNKRVGARSFAPRKEKKKKGDQELFDVIW